MRAWIRAAAVVIGLLLGGVLIVARWNRLPPLEPRTVSTSLPGTSATVLGKGVTPLAAAHPGHSGILPLRDPADAFAARYLLAQAAQRTLDVQYYIWRNDLSGTLLMNALVGAAGRGVRVRLLLDDNNTGGLDEVLAAVDAHPQIEVRLFNPFAIRKPRFLGYLTDFSRLNRRMHNKSFTADNEVTVIGGRNVGDEYFGATDGVLFADLDVIAVGPVVTDVSNDFDRYWSSESAYPAARLLPHVDRSKIGDVAAAAARVEREPGAVAYLTALRQSSFVRDLSAGTLPLQWAGVKMISDPPAKVVNRARPEELLFHRFGEIFGEPANEIDLVSPYFVPGRRGVELFTGWTKRGVKVRVLTNSLEATDVAVVHAGYAKRRKDLLKSGVILFELRRQPGTRPAEGASPYGSSGASLHAKTFAVDGKRIFIGSFNFDPRSAELNSEMGFVIDSVPLASGLAAVFETDIPGGSYEVRLTNAKELRWIERRPSGVVEHATEPGTRPLQRLLVSLMSALPIEPLL